MATTAQGISFRLARAAPGSDAATRLLRRSVRATDRVFAHGGNILIALAVDEDHGDAAIARIRETLSSQERPLSISLIEEPFETAWKEQADLVIEGSIPIQTRVPQEEKGSIELQEQNSFLELDDAVRLYRSARNEALECNERVAELEQEKRTKSIELGLLKIEKSQMENILFKERPRRWWQRRKRS